MTVTLANGYCTEADLRTRLSSSGVTLTGFDDEILGAINTASRWIDSHCGRHFYLEASAAVTYPPGAASWDRHRGCWTATVEDCAAVSAVATDGGDVGTLTTLSASEWYVEPIGGRTAGRTGWPATSIIFPFTQLRSWGRNPVVKVTGTHGWTAVPDDVRQASLIIGAYQMMLRQSPSGYAGMGEFGAMRMRQPKDALDLLAPFCRVTGTALGGFA